MERELGSIWWSEAPSTFLSFFFLSFFFLSSLSEDEPPDEEEDESFKHRQSEMKMVKLPGFCSSFLVTNVHV